MDTIRTKLNMEENWKQKYNTLVAVLSQAREDERKGYTFASVIDSIAPYIAKTQDGIIRDEIINFIKTAKPDNKNWIDYSSWIEWLETHLYTEEDVEKAYKNSDEIQWRDGFKYGAESQKGQWTEKDEEMREFLIKILKVNHPNGSFKANELGDPNMRSISTEEIVEWLESKETIGQVTSEKDREKRLEILKRLHIALDYAVRDDIIQDYKAEEAYSWVHKHTLATPTWKEEDDKMKDQILDFLRSGKNYCAPGTERRTVWVNWIEKHLN